MAEELGTLVARLQLDTQDLKRGEAEARATIGRLSTGFSSLGSVLASIGVTMGAAFSVRSIMEFGNEYTTQLQRAATWTGATRKELEALDKLARSMVSPSQAAEGIKALGLRGYDTSQTLSMLGRVQDYSRAHFMSYTESVDQGTRVLRAYHMESSQLPHVFDVMTKGAQISGRPIQDLADIMTRLGATPESVNMGFERMTGIVSALLKLGVPAEQMFAGLRMGLLKTGEVSDNLGMKSRDLLDVLEHLYNKNKDSEDVTLAFGRRTSTSLVPAAKNIDFLRESIRRLGDASGATARIAAEMWDTPLGRMERFKGALEKLKLTFYDALGPPLLKLVDGLRKMLDLFEKLPDLVKSSVVELSALAMLAVPLAAVAASLKTIATFGALASASGAASAAGGAVAGGVGGAVAGGAVAGAAIAPRAAMSMGAIGIIGYGGYLAAKFVNGIMESQLRPWLEERAKEFGATIAHTSILSGWIDELKYAFGGGTPEHWPLAGEERRYRENLSERSFWYGQGGGPTSTPDTFGAPFDYRGLTPELSGKYQEQIPSVGLEGMDLPTLQAYVESMKELIENTRLSWDQLRILFPKYREAQTEFLSRKHDEDQSLLGKDVADALFTKRTADIKEMAEALFTATLAAKDWFQTIGMGEAQMRTMGAITFEPWPSAGELPDPALAERVARSKDIYGTDWFRTFGESDAALRKTGSPIANWSSAGTASGLTEKESDERSKMLADAQRDYEQWASRTARHMTQFFDIFFLRTMEEKFDALFSFLEGLANSLMQSLSKMALEWVFPGPKADEGGAASGTSAAAATGTAWASAGTTAAASAASVASAWTAAGAAASASAPGGGGGIGGGILSLFGGGGDGSIPDFTSGEVVDYGGYAQGGIVTRPTIALVGENEPEIIVPMSKLAGRKSGGGTTVYMTVQATDAGSFQASQAQILARLRASLAATEGVA